MFQKGNHELSKENIQTTIFFHEWKDLMKYMVIMKNIQPPNLQFMNLILNHYIKIFFQMIGISLII
jgi:hypothetical protein